MQIIVKLFARAKDLAGTGTLVLEVPDTGTVGHARAALAHQCPALVPLMPVLFIALDGNYASDNTQLTDASELACFPPVSGG